MSAFSEAALEKKLSELSNSQQSVQTLSLWLIHHRKHSRGIVSVWDRELRKAKPNRKLTFLYLANDVIQNSKRKGPEFTKDFAPVIVDAFKHVSSETDESCKKHLGRVLSIWEERAVYENDVLEHLKTALYGERKTKKRPYEELKIDKDEEDDDDDDEDEELSKIAPEEPPQTTDLIHALQELENAASGDAAVHQRIGSLPVEVQDVSLLDKITDKASGDQLSKMVDDACMLLADYNGRLAAEIDDRKQLTSMLSDFLRSQKEVLDEKEQQLEMSSSGPSKRKSYSVEYKKGIVEESRGKNLAEFCKQKMLAERLVRKWRADYDQLSERAETGKAKMRKVGCGRQPMFTELESLVSEWVADRRAKTLVVTRAQIQEFALASAPQFEISPEEFKASQHWVDNFLERNDLSLRRSTTLFRLEDAEIVKRAFAYKKFVDDTDFTKYSLSNMIAMDETAVFMGQAAQTTIEQRGASSVYVPSTAYESARVTCILAIRLDGTKVPPLLIAKGKKDKIERVSGIYVLETEKAWATQAVIRKWLDLMLPLVMRGTQRGMLIWDAASTHRAKDMKNFLHERRIDQIMIPAGMTAYLQTLDIAINKPFKDYLRAEINDYIENRMERNVRGNFVKPRLPEIVNWVKNSWAKITDTCIQNALRTGYLDKTCSFLDSAVATHERYGPMILQKLESQAIPEEPQNLDVYGDVPEEDDMVVLE